MFLISNPISDHASLSGVTANQHHTRAHAMNEALDHSAITQGDVVIGGAAGAVTLLAASTSGKVLKTQGAGANPAFANPNMTLLYAVSGSDTDAAAKTIASIAITGLNALDMIISRATFLSSVAGTASVTLYHVTSAVGLGNINIGAIAADSVAHFEATISQNPALNTTYHHYNRSSSGATTRHDMNEPSGLTAYTGSWTLGLRHGGVTATGTLHFVWNVYLLRGTQP